MIGSLFILTGRKKKLVKPAVPLVLLSSRGRGDSSYQQGAEHSLRVC